MSLMIGNSYNYNNSNYSNYLTSTTTTNTSDTDSATSQTESSENSTQASHSGLHKGTIQFTMKNGMASSASVDGIEMSISDMILRDPNQLRERIVEKYNQTDAEKLEKAFGF